MDNQGEIGNVVILVIGRADPCIRRDMLQSASFETRLASKSGHPTGTTARINGIMKTLNE